MKNVLITGISGFAGSFLAEHLESQKKYEIFGTYLSDSSLKNVPLSIKTDHLYKLDLTDYDKVLDLISEVKPKVIFHLAAFSSTSLSYKKPSEAINTNINSELSILEAIRKKGFISTKILIVSSAEIYGPILSKDLPINEKAEIRPISPYGVSKIAQDFLGLHYFLSYKIPIIRVRPFNHLGPRMSSDLAPSAFAKKIAEIEKGEREAVLNVGNLSSKRDYTDVRDMVRAYALIVDKGISGDVYNIGSGKSYAISTILDTLLSFSKVKIKVKTDPELLRPNDIPDLVCDNRKIVKLTGWMPELTIGESLEDILDYWRNII